MMYAIANWVESDVDTALCWLPAGDWHDVAIRAVAMAKVQTRCFIIIGSEIF